MSPQTENELSLIALLLPAIKARAVSTLNELMEYGRVSQRPEFSILARLKAHVQRIEQLQVMHNKLSKEDPQAA